MPADDFSPAHNPYQAPSTAAGRDLPGKISLLALLFSFEGRITRKPWWLANAAIWGLLFLGGAVSEIVAPGGDGASDKTAFLSPGIVVLIPFFLCFFWSNWAITAKRYHDRGKSGWTQLLGFIPWVGGLIVLVECGFMEGKPGPNQYGPDPKDRT